MASQLLSLALFEEHAYKPSVNTFWKNHVDETRFRVVRAEEACQFAFGLRQRNWTAGTREGRSFRFGCINQLFELLCELIVTLACLVGS